MACIHMITLKFKGKQLYNTLTLHPQVLQNHKQVTISYITEPKNMVIITLLKTIFKNIRKFTQHYTNFIN